MAKFIFFGSLFMILYVHLGYPALVFLLALIKNKKTTKIDYEPTVTIIIAAHNEEKSIETTLQNKLNLDYPHEKLEIIVVSDGSTDQTDDIVMKYAKNGVRLLRQEPRAGKTAALNRVVPEAKGEILVFSDANSMYDAKALRMLVRNFGDPNVGYVTGKMIYTNSHGTTTGDGCSIYMKYENALRSLETKLGSVVGVDGGIDAIRKSLYVSMKPDQLPDFVLPLKVVEQGYRVIYEPGAIVREPSLTVPKDEYAMRLRVILRGFWALWDMRNLLFVTTSGLFAWQLWSHKLLRYLCFSFLMGMYFGNLGLLQENSFYKIFFLLQNMAYCSVGTLPFIQRMGRAPQALSTLCYFLLLNIAAAHAFIKFILGQKMVVWTPRKG